MRIIDFTVVIPTYNGENRIPEVLAALTAQADVSSLSWEILVVDNNSDDRTRQVVEALQKSWQSSINVSVRYCFESKQGLAYARQCGIKNARSELIGFIDDDVLPAPTWVSEAYKFGRKYHSAAAYGGQIHGNFEVSPPKGFERIKSFFAIRERGDIPHKYQPETLSLPPGAALVVRKSAWEKSVPEKLKLVGRINGMMLSGEDFEALLYLYHAGWEIWYCPTMHAYHQIPKHRLERDYLMALARGCGLCVCALRWTNVRVWQRPLVSIRIFLGGLRRFILYIWKYRESLNRDIIVAFEINFIAATIISPIFLLRKIL